MGTTCAVQYTSRSLIEHLVRGLVALLAFGFAFRFIGVRPLISLGLLLVAVIALRGCPACWICRLIFLIRSGRQPISRA